MAERPAVDRNKFPLHIAELGASDTAPAAVALR
jgi:hypothetical protein